MSKRNRNGTVLNLQDHKYPAAILNSQMVHPDPAHSWPGAPPEFGVVRPSHISTVQGWIGSQARTYPMEDEATRHSLQNCERMRRDPVIMECLKARQRAVALLPWSLQPEDESDSRQRQLVADLTSILERTYRFTELRRYLMEAIWYGKSFVHLKYGVTPMRGRWRKVVSGWEPRHPDKILFRYSDGTKDYVAGQIGIRVNMHARDISREQLDATQYGLAYFLRDHERRVCICHKHEVEDGSFQDVFGTGRLHGVGVRDTVYWTWYASKEVEQKLLEYLDRTALGIEIWRYPSGNKEAEAAARKAATERIGGGRSIVLVPVIPGEQAELFGVQHIEPGPAGAELLKTICQEFYGHRIKRLIMGQVLTSEAEATGMGSGVADAHLATWSDILRYDARNLEETLTDELVQIVKEENFPWARQIYVRLRIATGDPEADHKLQAYQAGWNMGLKIRSEDIYGLIEARRPDSEDDSLQNPQIAMAEQQLKMMTMEQQAMMLQAAQQPPGGPPGAPAVPGDQEPQGGAPPPGAPPAGNAPPPGAPAEVARDSAIEPAAVPASQTPDQQPNPWAGFWDSLFAAARAQGQEPPGATRSPGAVAEIPMPNGNGYPVPRVSRVELARLFAERFDHAIRVQHRTAAEFREALESALAREPDGNQLATTMQFLFAWKTAEPVGKLKAAFQHAMEEPAADPGPTPLQSALEANVATQLDTRATLRDTLEQPEAADPVKQQFQDAFTRQTAVREQFVQALRNADLTPDGTPEPDDYGLMGDLAKKAVVAGGIGLAALGAGCSGPACATKDEPSATSGFTDSPSQNVSTRLKHAKSRIANMQARDAHPQGSMPGTSVVGGNAHWSPGAQSAASQAASDMQSGSIVQPYTAQQTDAPERYAMSPESDESTTSQTQQASLKNVNWERLKQLGTTTDYREAGYLAPEGHMIDLSGKREGYRGPPQRNYDHREIGGTAAMQELVSAGHIRHVAENNGLDMKVRPTAKQYAHIRNIADRSNGEVTLDLQDGLGEYDEANEYYGDSPRRHNVEYPKGTRPDRIIRDIEAFYDGKDPLPPPEARYEAVLAPEQAIERYEAHQWTDAQLEAYALGRSHALGPEQYAKRKDSPGQRSLFDDDEPAAPAGKHDVSHEPRDESGRWTAGPPAAEKPEDSPAAAVDPPASVATLGQDADDGSADDQQPTSGSTSMTLTLSQRMIDEAQAMQAQWPGQGWDKIASAIEGMPESERAKVDAYLADGNFKNRAKKLGQRIKEGKTPVVPQLQPDVRISGSSVTGQWGQARVSFDLSDVSDSDIAEMAADATGEDKVLLDAVVTALGQHRQQSHKAAEQQAQAAKAAREREEKRRADLQATPLATRTAEEVGWRTDRRGARIYITGTRRGDPSVEKLKHLGAHWDPDQTAWWIGTGKAADLERLVADVNTRKAAGKDEAVRRRGAGFAVSIPYEATAVRDQAKRLGGRWDATNKQWLMPDGAAKEKIDAAITAHRQKGEKARNEQQAARQAADATRSRAKIPEGGRTFTKITELRGQGYQVGSRIRDRDGKVWIVTDTDRPEHFEDGLSMGLRTDDGYEHTAYARPLTEDEQREEDARAAEETRLAPIKRLKDLIASAYRELSDPAGMVTAEWEAGKRQEIADLDDQVRKLEGRPSADEEKQAHRVAAIHNAK